MPTPTKLVFDCSTGETQSVPLTADEIAQKEADEAAAHDAIENAPPSKNEILRDLMATTDPGEDDYNVVSRLVILELLNP